MQPKRDAFGAIIYGHGLKRDAFGAILYEPNEGTKTQRPIPHKGSAKKPPKVSKLVVYTAITGNYDRLREPTPWPGVEYVAFLDTPVKSQVWRVQPLPGPLATRRRSARFPKVMAHAVLPPDTEYSLWVDGCVTPVQGVTPKFLVAEYLRDADIAILRHPWRRCLYAEARMCMKRNLDDPSLISRQVSRYIAEGFPVNYGLGESGVVLRRHTANVAAFNEAWWSEIEHGSSRDQISFQYVAWKLGLKVAYLPQRRDEKAHFVIARHNPVRVRVIA